MWEGNDAMPAGNGVNCKYCPEYKKSCNGNDKKCLCYKCPRQLGQCLCIKYCRETESVLELSYESGRW
jgi:hypothetical protein